MNLHDLVVRRDRMILPVPGVVEAVNLKLLGGTQRAVRISEGPDGLLLGRADEASVLRGLSTMPGWVSHPVAGASLQVWLEGVDGTGGVPLGAAQAAGEQVRLQWPAPTPAQFNLRLVAVGGQVEVAVGPLFNPRLRLLPLLRGRGVEVGPGANPTVLPAADCEVSYVEKMSAEKWNATYSKGQLSDTASSHWDRYVVGEGESLPSFVDGSLDFIFSSHVLEHMVNPLGVIRNWWRKLAPGGILTGVVPDARFTFDLRQPHSSRTDFLEQYRANSYDLTDAMYERWCRYTAPYNTPDVLKAREYSIHVNYFSIGAMCDLMDLFAEDESVQGRFVESVTNGKDFAFLLQKT